MAEASPVHVHRALAEGTLTINNNCGEDITVMQAWHKYSPVLPNYEALGAGESLVVEGSVVESGEYLHFFGLRYKDGSYSQVAYAETESNVYHIAGGYNAYMVPIEDNFTVNLCTETVDVVLPVVKELTVINNCQDEITNFSAHFNDNSAAFRLEQGESIDIGESIVIPDVQEGSKFHYYGLRFGFDSQSNSFIVSEVASADEESNLYTHVTFTGHGDFPMYMVDIGESSTINLCNRNGPVTTTTTTTTTATTTTTTTTSPTTTTTTSTTTTSSNVLTITNNCGVDINQLGVSYNFEFAGGAFTYDQAPEGTITSGASITIDDFEGGYVHYYGLHLVFDGEGNASVSEVANGTENSNRITHVTQQNTNEQFPLYMKEIGEEMTLNLCVEPVTTSSTLTSGSLTITNNCGTEINQFGAMYNFAVEGGALVYDQAATSTIASGQSITIDDFEGGDVHFYGLRVVFDNAGNASVYEVASSDSMSNRITHITQNHTGEQFPVYKKTVGADMALNLCDIN